MKLDDTLDEFPIFAKSGKSLSEEGEPWQDIAARKRAQREGKIPPEWRVSKDLLPGPEIERVVDFPEMSGFFTSRELELTERTASEVVERISLGEWTAEEVTRAVCKRAAVAQQLVNCLTEIGFEEAIARAKELDEFFVREGKVTGPLHGLPISLKDQFNIRGLDSTIGYISKAFHPASKSSTLVDLLVSAGAILYAKTNVPTTLMMGETVNNIFGRTTNPFNRTLTPGGSSGGEAALIALGGSFLGVGTDIGGSIRQPCAYTGLYGLRPSHGRVSYQAVENTYVGQEAIRSCAGPMCRSPEDIRLFMASLLAQKPWLRDPQCLPIPWRHEEEVLPENLCFGWCIGDGRVNATPPVLRALRIVRTKLENAGHQVIDFLPDEMPEAHDIALKMWAADNGAEFRRDTDLSGEPLHPATDRWLKKSALLYPVPSTLEIWRNQHRRALLAQKWLEKWEATANLTGTGRSIDGLIMPTLPFPAVKHESDNPSHYGAFSPLLDLTTGSFPVTSVDLEADRVPEDWGPISEQDKEVMEFYATPENFRGSPVGLSIVGRRLEEEKVTAMLKVIGDVVGAAD